VKIHHFDEPELEFGGTSHIDIRYGIANYGPFDVGEKKRPVQINTGVIGTQQTVSELRAWMEKCRGEVAPELQKSPTRRDPVFPGFSADSPFKSEAYVDDTLCGTIKPSDLRKLHKVKNANERIKAAAEIYMSQIERLKGKGVDVVVCTLPIELLALFIEAPVEKKDESEIAVEAESDEENDQEQARWNFHDLLKARSMRFQIPVQLIRPSTWDRAYLTKEPDRASLKRQLQDEPLRAWNYFSALYYKAGGCPWRLPRAEGKLDTCFVGVSFYRTLDQTRYRTSLAQIFDELGTGMVVRGGEVKISEEDNKPHLDETAAKTLLLNALNIYRDEHHHQPAQIVVYKTSWFNAAEREGFKAAIDEKEVDFYRLFSMSRSFVRLYRDGYFPPLRGTCIELDDSRFILYTKGTVPFYEMYPGPYIPRTLSVRKEVCDASIGDICREILALTKMNWNNTQLDAFEPLPLRAAREVGAILKYCGDTDPIATFYRHYM